MRNAQKDSVQGVSLGRIAGLSLSAMPSTFWSMAAVWLVLTAVTFWLLGFGFGTAVLAGMIGVVIHWLSDFVHQLGHAVAAQRTGYPMTGLRFWGIFSTSHWPADEPELPGRVHLQRALGGPIASILIGSFFWFVAWLVGPDAGLFWWLAVLAAADNLLLLGVGAFAPLGFTDGSTILHWWNQ